MFARAFQQAQLSKLQVFNYKLRQPSRKATPWEIEKIQFKKDMKIYRKDHIKAYWERQTEIENCFIGKKFLRRQTCSYIKASGIKRKNICVDIGLSDIKRSVKPH